MFDPPSKYKQTVTKCQHRHALGNPEICLDNEFMNQWTDNVLTYFYEPDHFYGYGSISLDYHGSGSGQEFFQETKFYEKV